MRPGCQVTLKETGYGAELSVDAPPPGKVSLTCAGNEKGEEERTPGHGGDTDSGPCSSVVGTELP